MSIGPGPGPAGPEAMIGAGAVHRRTHPITPFVTGWKIVVGILAVVTAQNLPRLISDFTVRRALLAGGGVIAAVVIAIALSALAWWRTTYAIAPEGVVLHHGLLTRSRRTAPREKIESVSVERPALARALGLAKVRVEVAGGADSHLDIQYVTSRDAEEIRTRILEVAVGSEADEAAETAAADGAAAHPATGGDGAHVPVRERLRSVLHDGVTEGVLIAEIPTSRLLHSILRDVGFVLSILAGLAWAVIATVLALREEGLGIGFLVAVVPVILALPRMVLARLEAGWGFVSRLTDRGLRMRRGLFSTRTDNLAPGRIQDVTLSQPLLWRGPGWIGAKVTVAGVDGESENGPSSALPVGTADELARTLGHLIPSLGSGSGSGDGAADLQTIERLLAMPARQIEGLRPGSSLFWIGVRTRVAVLLPGALVIRSGILTRRLVIVPRERIQGTELSQGPLQRTVGCASLEVGVAASTDTVHDVPLTAALALRDTLAQDAAHGRLYRDRGHWPEPPLALDLARGRDPR